MPELDRPTSLNLFRLRSSEVPQAAASLRLAQRLNHEHSIALRAQVDLGEATQTRYDRLTQAVNEADSEQLDLRSSAIVGLMYLKMHDQLLIGQGLTDKEFTEYFRMAIKINDRIWGKAMSLLDSKGFNVAQGTEYLKGAKETAGITDDEVEKQYGNKPPAWFKGDTAEWKLFVSFHSLAQDYLRPQDSDYKAYGPDFLPPKADLPPEFQVNNLAILKTGHPDWFVENPDIIVSPEIVRKELEEDREAFSFNEKKIQKASDQRSYIARNVNNKGKVVVGRFMDLLRGHFLEPGSNIPSDFRNLLLYLGASYDVQTTTVSTEDLMNMNFRDFQKVLELPEQHIEKTIVGFANSRLTIETAALYLEKKLNEGGIAETVTVPLQEAEEPLLSLLDSVEDETQLHKYRGSKRLYNVLNYDLRPLVRRVPYDSVAYLRELVRVSPGEPVEMVIWELAEALKNSIDLTDFNWKKPKSTEERNLADLSKHARTWLRSNWIWAINEFASTVTQSQTDSGQEERPEGDSLNPSVAEIEQDIREAQEGAFSGWTLLYTDNRTTDPRHLHEIGGRTVLERQSAFKRFLHTEGVAIPHPDSIVRALEWVVEKVPDHVEQIRMRQIVGDEEFKKIKRGAARIFYISDPEERRMIFFAYRKKADEYRF